MKNKTKVILGLAAMLAGTVGIAGVSTYAWFVTQNTTKIAFSDAVVRGDTTDIAVEWTTIQPAGNNITDTDFTNPSNAGINITNNDTLNDLQIKGATTNIIDLSGDGYKFYHPQAYKKVAYESGAFCTGVTEYKNNDAQYGTVNYFMSFNVKVRNRGNVSTDVYLDTGSNVVAGTGAGVDAIASAEAAKAARVAIWQFPDGATDSSFEQTGVVARTLWTPSSESETNGYHFLSRSSTKEQEATLTNAFNYTDPVTANQVYDHTLSNESTVTTGKSAIFHAGTITEQVDSKVASVADITDDNAAIVTAAATKGGYICHLNALKEKIINVSMWIEGTDDQADVDCINGHVVLNLNFKGIQRTKTA